MFKTDNTTFKKGVGVAAAALALTFGASGAVSASTDTTEPMDDTATTHEGHEDTSAASLAVEAGEPSSPEAAAFCEAEVAAEAAFNSEDPALIEPAVEAIVAAAPPEIAETVGAVIESAEDPGSPEFAENYAAMIDYMKANCGYAQLNVAASEYAFGGLPPEVPAGPTIVSLENIGEEVHEIVVMRVNDDVTLSLDELLELPEEEAMSMTTFVGIAFTFPGDTGNAVLDLTPGRHVALCFLPEGAAPDLIAQMGGPEDTPPEGAEFGPPHFVLGMVHEFQVV